MFALLGLDVVLEVAHCLYASSYMSQCEERGLKIPKTTNNIHKLPDAELLPIISYQLGRIHQAWGYEVGLVFHHMGLENRSLRSAALFDLLMGCMGHGVSLADDFAYRLDHASYILNKWTGGGFNPVPVQLCSEDWDCLAREKLVELHGEPEEKD